MDKGTKVLVFFGVTITIGVAGYFIYRALNKKSTTKLNVDNSKQPQINNELSFDITNVDWDKKIVSFQVLLGGKTYMSEKIAWEAKSFGGEFGFVGSPLYSDKNKIEIVGANLPKGLVLVVKNNGENKFGKIIDFNSKTVKDYNGKNIVGDIAAAQKVLSGLMNMSFFAGTDFSSANGTPPPTDLSLTQKWVYTVENGKDYCRWYDRYGKNTRTYNQPCSKSQANMYTKK
jgi:uncharacterized protein YodC (DUF2158 family)